MTTTTRAKAKLDRGGLSPIALATAHYKNTPPRRAEVPEWGDESGPLVLYATPLSTAETQKLLTRSGGDALLFNVYFLIMKATDERGEPAFDLGDKLALMNQTDSNVIGRVVAELLGNPDAPELPGRTAED